MKPGQKLVCINKGGWVDLEEGYPNPGPKFNEVVTFLYNGEHKGYLVLEEYKYASGYTEEDEFSAYMFRPIISDKALYVELNEILFTEKV